MAKTQRWDWAIGLKLEELNEQHLQAAYKLNWDNLCKFDNCRKNCKRILCLACFDRSWIDNDSASSINYDQYDSAGNYEQKRADLKTFVGLKNLGATCYVNCLLQLWFHNPALRKAIYEWDPSCDIEKQLKQQQPEEKQSKHDDLKMIQSAKDVEESSLSETTQGKCSVKRTVDEKDQATPSKKKSKMLNNGEVAISNATSPTDSKPSFIVKTSIMTPTTTTTTTSTTTTTTTTSSSTVLTTTTSSTKSNVNSVSPIKSNDNNENNNDNNDNNINTKSSKEQQLQSNPIEQLQLIFARLQFTNKKSIDPFNFIDSLALNAAEQQDAQEFGNLFMEFLEKSFANQKNSFVSKIIQSQFCGRYSYATICDICKHSSLSDSNFYELDLSIQNFETLHDCLNEFFRPVPLDGKYNCSHCEKAQSAHRKIILKSLPPTLNLQLLRFVYDIQRNVRQKLNSYIIFPEILDMSHYLTSNEFGRTKSQHSLDLTIKNNNNYLTSNGIPSSTEKSNVYVLSAVLIHRGSSPHSGHYIAHIRDRMTKDWYKFNDDSVERIGPQLQVSTDGENITIVEDKTETLKLCDPITNKVTRIESKSLKSKTAYMLVYQAQDNEALFYPSDHSEKWMLPDHLQTAVAEENSRSEQSFVESQLAKEVDIQIMNARKNQIRTIYEQLVCRDPSEKFEFIDKNWLQRWLTASCPTASFPPIDNSNFLCCHGKLDFRKIDQVKCIRSEGAELLYKEFQGGPRLQDAMCRDCVELEVKLIQLKDRLKEEQKFITSQAKFKLEAGYDFDDAYIVGKNSYRDWQALVMVQFKKSYPELMNRERDSGNQQSSDEDDNNNNNNQNKRDKGRNSRTSKPNEEATTNNVGNNNSNTTTTNNYNNSDSESDDEAIEKFVFNSDILCDHQQLIIDCSAWRIVPKEVWYIFKNYFGNDPSRPLIELTANAIMCPDCKQQQMEQQELGDLQKMIASKQKAQLTDLFHSKKRASWCSMQPKDVFYALNRDFLTRWQKFIRNPCNQAQPTSVNNSKLVCVHKKSLYNYENSNPILQECPFILIREDELNNLREFYSIDYVIKFSIDPKLAEEKKKAYLMDQAIELDKKTASDISQVSSNSATATSTTAATTTTNKIVDTTSTSSNINNNMKTNSGDSHEGIEETKSTTLGSISELIIINDNESTPSSTNLICSDNSIKEIDLSEIDWSDCVICDPDFCFECHEMLKEDELKKLLSYESATIYITKVESPVVHGPKNNNPAPASLSVNQNGPNSSSHDHQGDIEVAQSTTKQTGDLNKSNNPQEGWNDIQFVDEQAASAFKRRRKIYVEDEANDFVPSGAAIKPQAPQTPQSNSILRRTTRRNRNREQAYTIKPDYTLLQLKKDIFLRCQVLPSDQRLFLDDMLLNDNTKTMAELKIVPNCSLKLEVDRPVSDNIDLIEDESTSRKSSAQPETGFKGSLLLSNSHL